MPRRRPLYEQTLAVVVVGGTWLSTRSALREAIPITEEDASLRKLLEQPNNDLTRVVYADWLDEQQTPEARAKAQVVRPSGA